jgi:hypothetical protein
MIANPIVAGLRYSPELVALVRALDAASLEVGGALDYYGHREDDMAPGYTRRASWEPWLHANAKRLSEALAPMRAVCSGMIVAESAAQGLSVALDETGDVLCPPSIELNWDAVWHLRDVDPGKGVLDIPDLVERNGGPLRAVCFADGEVYPIDDGIDASAVLVWFRRALGRMRYGPGPYSCSLVDRPYGWQAFAQER